MIKPRRLRITKKLYTGIDLCNKRLGNSEGKSVLEAEIMELIWLFLVLLVNNGGSLAADRIIPTSLTFSHSNHDPKYKIELHSADAPFHPELGQESILMTDRDGQKSECFLPKPEENKDMKEVSQQYSSSVTLATNRQSKIKTPDELLEVLKDHCLLRHEGWWSYEFCYKRKVQQAHLEDKKVMQEFVLGIYDEEATAALHRNSPDVSIQKDPRSKTAAQRYHAHLYTNGTICDLTNEPRETEVRFMCSESSQAYINSIKEVSTCKYALIVQGPMLCKHPLFQEERPTWYTINCNSLSNSNEKAEKEDKEKQIVLGGLIPSIDSSESAQAL
eukprot:Gb_21349 [translate_table: standard]